MLGKNEPNKYSSKWVVKNGGLPVYHKRHLVEMDMFNLEVTTSNPSQPPGWFFDAFDPVAHKTSKLTSWPWQFIPLFTGFYTTQVISRSSSNSRNPLAYERDECSLYEDCPNSSLQ